MAQVIVRPQSPPVTIDRFLGLNEDTSGDTQLQIGESPNMLNFRLTENYKLRKREGYEELFPSMGNHDVQGMWYGKVAGDTYFLFACGGKVYKFDGDYTEIGTLTDDRTNFFAFRDKVYLLNGHEYKSWDGATFQDVEGYVPLVATATPPSGGGSDNEQINLLTGKKRQRFSGDNTATEYQLRELDITSVNKVLVNGALKPPSDYSVDLSTGKVTFTVAPPTGVDNVEIEWTKGTGSRSEVFKHRFSMFYGGQNDTRVFFYGNGTNRYIYSGLADGVPSAEYFPALNYREVSSNEYEVTDIVRQYDRQIIFTNGGEAWYSYYDTIEIDGDVVPDFPTFPLNDAIGHVAIGQAQLIQNNPYSIQNGVYEWVATNVRDERNAAYKSNRVQPSLDGVDLSKAITVDREKDMEYWLAIDNMVWVYNYRLDAWYKFQLAHNVTCFLMAEDELYFGTDQCQIMKFDRVKRTDNGELIEARCELSFYDFESEWQRKFSNEMWMTIQPEYKSGVELRYQTDIAGLSSPFSAFYNLASFENVDFGNWSFLVNYNPQPFRFKIKAKKFVYFKLIFTNRSIDQSLTVLSVNLPVRYGSKVK